MLNPSLNQVDLRMHQNTSVFVSKVGKEQGTIGTTTVVPYAVVQIHGWINPFAAKHTGLKNDDVQLMLETLWDSVNNANTRSKSNQSSLLLLQIVYSNPRKKLYRASNLIKVIPKDGKRDEQLRGLDDFTLDFSGLHKAVENVAVEKVRYYTEIEVIEDVLKHEQTKFEKMSWNTQRA
jgi:CRISPR-associated protein Csh2